MVDKSPAKRHFFFPNLSIEQRLPLLIFILLFIVIAVLAWTSYFGVKSASLEVARDRLNVLTQQMSSLLQASNKKIELTTNQIAEDYTVKNYLLQETIDTKKITESFQNLKFSRDTSTLAIEIKDKKGITLFTTNNSFDFPVNIKSELIDSLIPPRHFITGKLYAKGDSVIYPIAAMVMNKNKPIGYVVRWRLILSNKKAMNQLANLLGASALLYVGNKDGSMWTDLIRPLPKPPVESTNAGIVEYSNLQNDPVIAAIHQVPGSYWVFLIELSKSTLLKASTKFLNWIVIIGIVVLAIGFFIAWIISRNITKPLNRLTLATSDIAIGNYSTFVKVERKDELGKLADSFNTMVTKVRDSQFELETKVEDRTVQLKAANKKLEGLNEKLKQLDKVKTDFFTNISHELRTPLALILGRIEKLLSENPAAAGEKNERELRLVQQNARILLKHVNNLLDISKLEVGKLKVDYINVDLVSIVKIISSYFESLAREQGINFNIDLPGSLRVQADPEKIERILMNLLSNAFKFTPDNGSISCRLYKKDNEAAFEIKDNGPGIKPELIKSIFDRFQQGSKGLNRNLGGTGLGLSITKEFIELHNGKIEVKNSDEGGAVFNFSIPLKAPEKTEIRQAISENISILDEELKIESAKKNIEPENNAAIKKQNSGTKQNAPSILIVEDNVEMNRFISDILKDEYNTYSAFDGEEGLKKVFMHKPDLILTDVMMPKMSGDKFVDEIKMNPELASIPIILLTAKADEQLKIELLKKGAQDYLNKPFTIEELKARIKNIIKIKISKDLLQKELRSYSNDLSSLVEELMDEKHLVESSLREKEILLREIHHRVKNNFQIISSLLNLQTHYITDENSLSVYNESKNRIKTMALVHEKLYQSNDLSKIDFRNYIEDLLNSLLTAYTLNGSSITNKIKIEDIDVNVDDAVLLGLIINELVTNLLKHAFKGIKKGEIEVKFYKNNTNKILIVKDNGAGLPSDFDLNKVNSLGLSLVSALVEQLNGSIEFNGNNNGTEIKITFD